MSLSNTRLFPQAPRIDSADGSARVEFAVPARFFFCDGHFPTTPLVPGAVLAGWMREAAELAGSPETVRNVRNLKFRGPVAPGDPVTVSATRLDSGVRVTLHAQERLCADALFFA